VSAAATRQAGPSTVPRVVVAGTGFGRAYRAAFERPDFPFRLAGVLANGSDRSRACAKHYGVPLWTSVGDVAPDVDMACVVVGGVMNGGRGTEISRALMARGLHVLQEHPVHPDELTDCLRTARAHHVSYRVNTHYVHVEPVRRFIDTAHRLLARQRPLFVDVTCGFQVLYTVFDILGEAIGTLRPWSVSESVTIPEDGVTSAEDHPYRVVSGTIGGVPMTFRLQTELVPSDPDNYSHLFHRITIGTEGGHLTLANTHGPVQWSMRPHMPADMSDLVRFGDSAAPHLAAPSVEYIGPDRGATYLEVLRELWPKATAAAMTHFWQEVHEGRPTATHVQYHIALTRIARAIADACGPVRLLRRTPPELLTAADLQEVS
jgi:pyochelin biosynthetic protein PchG